MENMQPPNQQELQQQIELRMRTLRTLWIAMLMSVGAYFVLTLFLHRSEDARPNGILSLILAVISFSAILISLPLKSRPFPEPGGRTTANITGPTRIYSCVGCNRSRGVDGAS
jgi:hypothetical protein